VHAEASADPVEAGATKPPARSLPVAVVVSLRPRQWIKNLVLLAPLVFARQGDVGAALLRALAALVIFCGVTSSVYLFNDLLDRDRDRLHPEKRYRPIAAGQVPVSLAATLAGLLVVCSLAFAVSLSQPFAWACLDYVVLQVAYTLWLKHLVLLDVFAVAAGFVLRVVAGGLVIGVPISNWLYLCTLLLALFLAMGKRRAELSLVQGEAGSHRRSLVHYSVPLLDQLITILAACTVLAYALYTLAPETVNKFGTDRLKYTVPLVIYGLFRYLFLIHRRGAGGSPERVLLSDVPLLTDVALFVGMVVLILY
jgi:4-hydroxybenzoate polyprenyltransferase